MNPISASSTEEARAARYTELLAVFDRLFREETDWIAAMSTAACELHHAFAYFHWTGFYRAVSDTELVVGPYQGTHGCLRIEFGTGVCGTAAQTRQTQFVPNVHLFPGHIACSSSTESEIVVPVLSPDGRLLGVFDVDSDLKDVFTPADQLGLEQICAFLGRQYANTSIL